MDSTLTKAPCRSCHRLTKHAVLATRQTSDDAEVEGVGTITWDDKYDLLECCGCESVTLRHTHSFSESPEDVVAYYPPAVSRRRPAWRLELPHKQQGLLSEVYSALDANNRRLALMGARTALDMVLADKVGDAGTFAARLAELEKKGFVAPRNRQFLEAALDAGSAAAHRGYLPTAEHLGHVMDIIENVQQAVYGLEKAADEIRKATPARAGKNKAKSAVQPPLAADGARRCGIMRGIRAPRLKRRR